MYNATRLIRNSPPSRISPEAGRISTIPVTISTLATPHCSDIGWIATYYQVCQSLRVLCCSGLPKQSVQSLGADVRRGDLDNLDGLATAAREADGVIHLAFNHDEQHSGNLAGAVTADLRAIETMGDAL